MKVYELKIKVFLLKDINYENVSTFITRFLDMCISQNEGLLKFHNAKVYKPYSFDMLIPFEEDKMYKKEKIYSFRLRTINLELANYILEKLPNFYNEDMKGLIAEVKILPRRIIEKVYTLTPALLKNEEGYWKHSLNFEKFEERLRINCIKKYRYFSEENILDTVPIYTNLIFKNKKPVPIKYKNINLRGDKFELIIANDEISQKIVYMLLGVGILENCSRGCGFLEYRYIK